MSSRHLLDPELAVALEFFPVFDFTGEGLATTRAGLGAMIQPIPEDIPVRVEDRRIDGAQGHQVRVLVFTPERAATGRAAICHIHGGGYILGTPELNAATNAALAVELDCVIVSVDYRLAPETVHPGPIEDCYAALLWLYRQANELGVDRTRIALKGESAGGGLAASLALLARDRGEVPLIHQHLIYPMVDDRTCVTDRSPFAGEYCWNAAANHFGWSSLLGHAPGGDDVSPYAAAARAEDLSGLPSTFIMVGTLDLFLEEDMDYARRLIHAGVPTELHIYPGAYHAFDAIVDARVAADAKRDSIAALRRGLSPR